MLIKVHIVKAMIFPVVTCRFESWTIKKAEGQRIDAFELWCWRRLLRAPWTARRSNQLRSSNFKYSLEGLMLKLKLQYVGHLMKTTSLLEKTLMPGMWETRVWSLGWEDPLEEEMATHSSTLAWRIPWREEPGRLQSMGSQRVGHDWATSLHYQAESVTSADQEVPRWLVKTAFLGETEIVVRLGFKSCFADLGLSTSYPI